MVSNTKQGLVVRKLSYKNKEKITAITQLYCTISIYDCTGRLYKIFLSTTGKATCMQQKNLEKALYYACRSISLIDTHKNRPLTDETFKLLIVEACDKDLYL